MLDIDNIYILQTLIAFNKTLNA